MKVSVSMIAYNHEQYVALALESALAQEVNFDFEVVVGEDCSTDGTRGVIEGLGAKYPAKVRFVPRERNVGMERNHRETISACRGEYIAVLDSDDYWTSGAKLARQVALMDENPEMVISFHRAQIVDGAGKPTGEVIPGEVEALTKVEDLYMRNYIPSCSVMYRRSALPPFPEWYDTITTYDWPLHILTASSGGTIGFIGETLAAYRIHDGGAYSQLKERKRLDTEINCLQRLLDVLPDRQLAAARYGLADKLFDLADHLRRNRDLTEARQKYREAKGLQSWGRVLPWRRRARMWARLYLPGVAKASNRLGGRSS